ncbi:trypsin-like peptidase domain-containing protein [Cupriavidus basilensis]|uniref:trypsin-like peptidase domain-containing protein n=1 Tax=Cupriavidus basilensis TaxID=68895 RepID=UPI0023E87852|nr:S1C family serine protease [Cupriavidus basilensis]MDF3885171.1 S1C family serine protease [Cupriavidus basilensis]
MVEPILLAAVRVSSFDGQQPLTNASGFFFERDGRLFVVTSRHVLLDEPSKHHPDRIEIELHSQPENMADSIGFSIPLYRDGLAVWREGEDGGGPVDVGVVELERKALPPKLVYRAFTPEHLARPSDHVEVGDSLLIVGFPLGFHDALHHLPVARQAVVASAYGLRFQGQGFFLTDARTHRGTSGALVVSRMRDGRGEKLDLPWMLLGIHSARFDVGSRDLAEDEVLGLNSAWYADMLLTLTEPAKVAPARTAPGAAAPVAPTPVTPSAGSPSPAPSTSPEPPK